MHTADTKPLRFLGPVAAAWLESRAVLRFTNPCAQVGLITEDNRMVRCAVPCAMKWVRSYQKGLHMFGDRQVGVRVTIDFKLQEGDMNVDRSAYCIAAETWEGLGAADGGYDWK